MSSESNVDNTNEWFATFFAEFGKGDAKFVTSLPWSCQKDLDGRFTAPSLLIHKTPPPLISHVKPVLGVNNLRYELTNSALFE